MTGTGTTRPGAAGPDAAEFIRAHTEVATAPLVPEIRLHLATAITPIWQASEAWLEQANIEPPFWAFAWPGGQALARHVLDHPDAVRGKRVLDFAAGCAIAAIACARAVRSSSPNSGHSVTSTTASAPAHASIADGRNSMPVISLRASASATASSAIR